MASSEEIVGSTGLPTLGVDDTGATTFVAIAEIIADPTPGELSRASIDMTHTDLTNGATKQKGGWQSQDGYTFLCNWREDTWVQLEALMGNDIANWEYTWTDPGGSVTDPSDTFVGFIVALSKQTPVGDDRWTITVTIQPEEVVTYTESTDA